MESVLSFARAASDSQYTGRRVTDESAGNGSMLSEERIACTSMVTSFGTKSRLQGGFAINICCLDGAFSVLAWIMMRNTATIIIYGTVLNGRIRARSAPRCYIREGWYPRGSLGCWLPSRSELKMTHREVGVEVKARKWCNHSDTKILPLL